MTSYTQVFGGNVISASRLAYRAVTLSASQTLAWPTEANASANLAADILDVTASQPGFTITMPDATLVSPGASVLFNNVGAQTFTVADKAGGTIVSVVSGSAWQAYLTDNSTAAGTWRIFQYGASVSVVNAGALSGAGLKAISSTLNQSMPVAGFSAAYTAGVSDRAKVLLWTSSGSGTLSLTAAGTLGSDWFVNVRNSGGGALTIDPAGSEQINGSSTISLQPGDSCIVFSDGAAFYTIGLGQSVASSVSFQSIAVGGSGDYTLSAAEQNKVLYKLTGTLTGTRNIIVPSTIQQYWIDNATSGAYSLYVGTAAQIAGGTGVLCVQGQRSILYCDGSNVVDADTSTISVPIVVSQGGTGSTTANGALINLGGTATGISLFTAASTTAARTTIGAVGGDEAISWAVAF